jgi:polysaccharide pyruvyl transferase WcaK-like protein
MENLDLMVSMKLHAGILAAAANVPFVSLEYRPKCRDFGASLGWEEFLIRTDQLQQDSLIERVLVLMGQLEAKKRELCQKMCRLMNTFDDYCCKIEPLLLGSG